LDNFLGKVTHGMDDRALIRGRDRNFFIFSSKSRSSQRPIVSNTICTGGRSTSLKRLEHETDNSSASGGEINYVWSFISTLLYVFMT